MASKNTTTRKRTATKAAKRRTADAWQVLALSVPRMKVFLVGGCHPMGHPNKWRLASKTLGSTTSLKRAALFPFNREWKDVALGAAYSVKPAGDWEAFTARVMVEGDPESPTAVIPCWKLEGRPEPQHVEYPFDPPSVE